MEKDLFTGMIINSTIEVHRTLGSALLELKLVEENKGITMLSS